MEDTLWVDWHLYDVICSRVLILILLEDTLCALYVCGSIRLLLAVLILILLEDTLWAKTVTTPLGSVVTS